MGLREEYRRESVVFGDWDGYRYCATMILPEVLICEIWAWTAAMECVGTDLSNLETE